MSYIPSSRRLLWEIQNSEIEYRPLSETMDEEAFTRMVKKLIDCAAQYNEPVIFVAGSRFTMRYQWHHVQKRSGHSELKFKVLYRIRKLGKIRKQIFLK